MNIKDKFMQMIMIGMDIDKFNDEVIKLIRDYKIGGVVLYKKNYNSIDEMQKLINKLKDTNKNNTPLFIAIDQENGRVNRIPDEIERIYSVGKQASTKNDDIIHKCNKITSNILRDVGVNMNLAPVVDINYDNSKIIGNRSYGSSASEVIRYATISMNDYKEEGIIPVVKHFPGHGLVNTDSHYLMPVISDTKKMEDDLLVYDSLIKSGCDALMVGHLKVSGYGSEPATFNKNIIKKYLIDRYNYQGLIITDDLRMNTMKYIYGIKNMVNKSIQAGSNILMIKYKRGDTRKLYKDLYKMVDKGKIDNKLIEDSYNKIINIKNKYKISNDKNDVVIDIDKINKEIRCVNKEIDGFI